MERLAAAAINRIQRTPFPDRMGIVGDSRAACYSVSGTTNSKAIVTPAAWLEFFSHGRFRLNPDYDKAVGGSSVADTVGQMQSLVAVTPKCSCVFILTGTNSFSSGVTAASAWASLSQTIDIAVNAGIRPIVALDLPRTQASYANTSVGALNSQYFNEMIRRNAYTKGYTTIDLTSTLADPASSTGNPFSSYYNADGIHMLEKGAILAGQEANGYFTAKPVRSFGSARDTYDATNNPTGNLLSNGLMTGTGGTNAGTGSSGTVATSYTNRVNGGTGTSVASIVARTDGGAGSWQQLVISDVTGSLDVRLHLTSAITTGFATGDKIVLEADIEISGATNMFQIGANMLARGVGAATKGQGIYAAPVAGSLWPDGNFTGRFITPHALVTSDTTDLYPQFIFLCGPSGGSVTVRLGAITVRKVA